MPKEKNSAEPAISPAVSAARGSSIIVPNRYGTSTPSSCMVSLATRSSSDRSRFSSLAKPTSGIITSGRTCTPSLATVDAARKMARTCISFTSG